MMEVFAKSDVGLIRSSNQDSWCVDLDLGVILVADGMGGRAGGEVASDLAVRCICDFIRKNLKAFLGSGLTLRRTLLSQAINVACLKIYERSLELPQYRGMGTTCTLLWVPPEGSSQQKSGVRYGNYGLVAHVGDSRCYLLRSGLLYQITEDHSLVNEHIKAGLVGRHGSGQQPTKNIITRCLGPQEEEEVETFIVELYKNDKFLLCSDGLSNKVNHYEIAKHLSTTDFSQCPDNFISLANERGGEDNITAVVAQVV